MEPGALADLAVLDLSNLFAAPLVSAILGDFGARVVKVEPPGGDPLRRMGVARDGRSLMWAFVNRNKQAITLDLDTDEGRELLGRLVAHVDVVVENFTPELRARRHCTYDELAAVNPGLVVVSVSCYGTDGPYADRPGAGTLAEAFGGLTHLTGDADGPPMLGSFPLGDALTGIVGALGAVVACHGRGGRADGRGQHVDVSMYEPVLALLGGTVAGWDPGTPPPRRTGSRVPGGAPRNVYRTADDVWIAVSGTTDAQVARVLPVIGHDTDEDRRRFGRSHDRLSAADELDALVAQWVGANCASDVLDALLAARVPAAPVNDMAAIATDPHIRARGDLVAVDDAELGPVTMVAPVPRLVATPGAIRWTGPSLGAHNDDVYRGMLGLGDGELGRLRDAGVV
jgi:crotonobetainyl-CoA:carnitine CoA-transferase CaiB-like acyl-CoA transferase